MSASISVIIPTLNEASTIDATLTNVRMALGDCEIIVVDGGSGDDTVPLAQQVDGVTVLEHARGRAMQLNAGAAMASGDVLVFLHADVHLPPGAAQEIQRVLATPRVVAGAFRTHTVMAAGASRRPWMRPLLRIVDLRSRYTRRPYGDQALFVWRSVFEQVGGYPNEALMEDLAFSHVLARQGKIGRSKAEVVVSGRRFVARPMYYTVVMNTFPLLYALGVPTAWLAMHYHPER